MSDRLVASKALMDRLIAWNDRRGDPGAEGVEAELAALIAEIRALGVK